MPPSTTDLDDKGFGSGKLEKAVIVRYKKTGNSDKVVGRMHVQFNPAEYSIVRGQKHSSKRPLGRDTGADDIQTVHSEPSVLSLSLTFDSYTELLSDQGLLNHAKNITAEALMGAYNKATANLSFPSFDLNEDLSPKPDMSVNKRFIELLELIKYDHVNHEPPRVRFVWGKSISFKGMLISHEARYTLFDRDGTPVRAVLQLSIAGEDALFDNTQNPMESPDRTKQRTLHYGEQLWMMAREEYGDAAMWKTIAEANGILNPRMMSGATRLRIPAIR